MTDIDKPIRHKTYETVIYNFITGKRFALLKIHGHCNAPDCKRERDTTSVVCTVCWMNGWQEE